MAGASCLIRYGAALRAAMADLADHTEDVVRQVDHAVRWQLQARYEAGRKLEDENSVEARHSAVGIDVGSFDAGQCVGKAGFQLKNQGRVDAGQGTVTVHITKLWLRWRLGSQPNNVNWRASVGLGPIAQLPVAVASPTLHATFVGARAAEQVRYRDVVEISKRRVTLLLVSVVVTTHLDRSRTTGVAYRTALLDGLFSSQLAVQVGTPA